MNLPRFEDARRSLGILRGQGVKGTSKTGAGSWPEKGEWVSTDLREDDLEKATNILEALYPLLGNGSLDAKM